MKVIVISHYTPIMGVAHHLVEYLTRENISFKALFLPLNKDSTLPYKIIEMKNGIKQVKKYKKWNNFFTDFIFTLEHILPEEFDIYVGIDPFNVLTGLILKRFFKNKCIVVFYSVDYSPKRFSNIFLNTIYRLIDTIAVKYADYVWCVSKRMTEIRKTQSHTKNKILYVPNGSWVDSSKINPKNKKGNIDFVFVGTLGKQFDLDLFINQVNKINNLKLHIIGDGPDRERLEEIANNNVKFYGLLSNDKILDMLKGKKWIGIAPYNKKVSHILFGSSLKVIEYLSCGIPVITSNIVEISNKIKKYRCGFVYDNPDQIKKILKFILGKKFNYEKYSKNCLYLAKKFYWKNIYQQAFQKIQRSKL